MNNLNVWNVTLVVNNAIGWNVEIVSLITDFMNQLACLVLINA